MSIDLKTQKLRNAMTALMLGVTAGVIAILVERVDTIAGGNFLGYLNTYTWILVSAVLFGFVGAIITTEIQALIGLINLSGSLSPLWPIINLLFAIGVGAVAVAFTRFRPQAKLRTKLLAMSTTCAILDIPLVYVVMVMAFGLPYIAYLAALPVYIVLQLVPSTILSYMLVKTLKRSKVLT
ncbi:hypothetical protein [Candidatus Bathycorpusculum sp.]|uniref:hypothetical protein n=1 Tax=Candidatus Bathycorpusculum sp. TaxID=2994959 RepID=UPI002838240D|nr:hypothetical protein [Candidatus Termitimicrobium sp.]MCL2431052.1 hypothetical protein [Candidatus Termitimicrobium sp.]